MLRRVGVLKEFGPEGLKVVEEVAKNPSMRKHGLSYGWKPDIFCLRIDADEHARDSFDAYYPLFEKYKNAMTIFFNASSFRQAEDQILRCRDLGMDIQSHGFYHYTYNDYASNRENIRKGREFFLDLGIETNGFAAPMGRWNVPLMRALEDEGYKYSSDFSYDYMGFPSYPSLGSRCSGVLEIPVFPIAPELFFQRGNCGAGAVAEYYKNAIDGLIEYGLPVIIYAHTHSTISVVPSLLEEVVDHAVRRRKLKPVSVTGFFDMWTEITGTAPISAGEKAEKNRRCPYLGEAILGRPVARGAFEELKDMFKNMMDFERITPDKELKCGMIRKMLKLLARKAF